MALELHIAGPGLDVSRRVEPGQPPVILGRDAECTVCLPDPEKNVSRRHLSVWNEGDELHFHVLSVVNAVEMPFGDAPPGARGVLKAGQSFKIAEYSVEVGAADDPTVGGESKAPNSDPWAALEDPPEFAPTQPAPYQEPGVPTEADPFGDWGFDTFGSDAPSGPALHANSLQVAPDISAFYQGLGLDAQQVGVLSQGELEAIGRLVRMTVMGLIDLHKSVAGSKQDLKSEDRTMIAAKEEKNPLKEGDLSDETLMNYLFGGRAAAAAGYLGPERAVKDVITELTMHEKATAVAARAVVEGILREFDPEALKTRLLGGGSRLFESARAWDAFAKDYEEQGEDPAKWVQRLLNKYFTSAYVRETMRVKRDTAGRSR